MDYVIITAILTFFVLLFFVKNKEGYTDSYINSGIESLKKTNENISKTVITIKNFTGTNVGSTEVKIDVLDALEQLNESLKVNSTTTPISSEILIQLIILSIFCTVSILFLCFSAYIMNSIGSDNEFSIIKSHPFIYSFSYEI
jgi:hypothetical protein